MTFCKTLDLWKDLLWKILCVLCFYKSILYYVMAIWRAGPAEQQVTSSWVWPMAIISHNHQHSGQILPHHFGTSCRTPHDLKEQLSQRRLWWRGGISFQWQLWMQVLKAFLGVLQEKPYKWKSRMGNPSIKSMSQKRTQVDTTLRKKKGKQLTKIR